MPVPDLTPTLTDSQKINMNIISLNTAVNDLQTDVSKLTKLVITGNGEIPLAEKVRNHESFISEVKYWVKWIGGALLIQTIAFLSGVVIAVVKFLPVLERLANQP